MKIVFWICCAAFAVVVGGVLFGAVTGMIGGKERALDPALVAVLDPAMTIWLCSAGVLWIYSFVVLGRRWSQRTDTRNYLLLFFILFFGILAAPYIYWKRETL